MLFLVPFWCPLIQRMGGTHCVDIIYIYTYIYIYIYTNLHHINVHTILSIMAMQKLNRNIIYVELLDGNPSIRGHIEQALMAQRMRDSPIPGRIFDDIYGCSNVVWLLTNGPQPVGRFLAYFMYLFATPTILWVLLTYSHESSMIGWSNIICATWMCILVNKPGLTTLSWKIPFVYWYAHPSSHSTPFLFQD